MRLKSKVAVVTGGTKGLGRAITEAFLSEGARVVCAARDGNPVKDLLEAHPDGVAFQPVDVRDAASVAALMQAAADRFGRLDIVVANAGVSRAGPVRSLGAEQWDDTIATNLNGVLHCTQAAVPHLERGGGGRIINLSSAMSSRAFPGTAAYCASKAAIEMFTKVSAIEVAQLGITANCLSPGVIDEGMGRLLTQHAPVWSQLQGLLAMGRPGRAGEVASAAVFLAGDESSYVNGHVLEVTGGLLW